MNLMMLSSHYVFFLEYKSSLHGSQPIMSHNLELVGSSLNPFSGPEYEICFGRCAAQGPHDGGDLATMVPRVTEKLRKKILEAVSIVRPF